MCEVKVRFMKPGDWDAVRRIYLDGMATNLATFRCLKTHKESKNEAAKSLSRVHLVAGRGRARAI